MSVHALTEKAQNRRKRYKKHPPETIVIGLDPDSEANAIATYVEGRLIDLRELQIVPLIDYLADLQDTLKDRPVAFCIENVLANNFVYARNVKANRAVQDKVAVSIGRNQQAQTEVMRILDFLKIPYSLVPPSKQNWANDKATFERITGWSERSNKDTRSAAYFGWLLSRSVHNV